MNSVQISVVVPTYQRRESLRRLLSAFERQTINPELFEVLVVIDGSSDGTDELITNIEATYSLRSIRQPNLGRATACNTGIRRSKSNLIILLDDDMEPDSGFLSAHWSAHQGRQSLGVLGAVPVAVRPGASFAALYIAEKFKRHLEKLSQPGYQLRLRDFYSGNFSIRKEYLYEVGLFDERFKIYGNEDLELFLRLRKADISLTYCADALAYQHYEKDFSALARDNIAKGKTAVLFARKHPEVFQELKLSTYNAGSRKRRLLRTGLLQFSRVWRGIPDNMIRFVIALERIRLVGLQFFYSFLLDYFYWLGVQDVH